MKNTVSASYEARIKNSRDLIISIKKLPLYDPSAEDIKTANYELFVNEADAALTPYKSAMANVKNVSISANKKFAHLNKISRLINSEMIELKGDDAPETQHVRRYVSLLTGDNIKVHSKIKINTLKNLKEGDPKPEFQSVSELDNKSRLGNFRSLKELLRSYPFYSPNDASIALPALDILENELTEVIDKIAESEVELANARSIVNSYFEDKGGLKDRAKRARVHVKRKYGLRSSEYSVLKNKKY